MAQVPDSLQDAFLTSLSIHLCNHFLLISSSKPLSFQLASKLQSRSHREL